MGSISIISQKEMLSPQNFAKIMSAKFDFKHLLSQTLGSCKNSRFIQIGKNSIATKIKNLPHSGVTGGGDVPFIEVIKPRLVDRIVYSIVVKVMR